MPDETPLASDPSGGTERLALSVESVRAGGAGAAGIPPPAYCNSCTCFAGDEAD